MLTSTANHLKAVRYRLAKAETCFWRYQSIFCTHALTMQQRFHEFASRVQPVALYGSGAWVWSRSVYNELTWWENAFLWRLAQLRRKPLEDFVMHQRRATTKVRRLFHTRGYHSLVTRYLDTLHRIAGTSFARLCVQAMPMLRAGDFLLTATTYEKIAPLVQTVALQQHQVEVPSQCFLASCTFWCDWQWWQWRQAVGLCLDPGCNETVWRHDRSGPHLRWESVFVKALGDKWKDLAAQADWQRRKGEFRTKAYSIFGAKSFEERCARKDQPSGPCERIPKQPRLVSRLPLPWAPAYDDMPRLEILGDSDLVIHWVNGQ